MTRLETAVVSLCLLGVCGVASALEPFAKPVSKGPVRVEGRRILVNGEPFFLQGVGYQPVPIGQPVEFHCYDHPEIYERDLEFLRSMGCNTIRTWAGARNRDFLDACYNDGVDPIYVITGPWLSTGINLADPAVRKSVADQWESFINDCKDHPAILMWQLGNEYNYWYRHDVLVFLRFANDLARMAYEIEGDSYHPFTTAHGGIQNASAPIGAPAFFTDDASMNYIDVWGVNIYSGPSFDKLLEIYSFRSSKPLWISEFGCDALDDRTKEEYPDVHARFIAGLWDELVANSDIVSGGTLMAYSDEWWKGGDPTTHDKNGWGSGAQPDGVSNEEWYGIVAVEKQEEGPDRIRPRQVCEELKKRWMTPVRFKDIANRKFTMTREQAYGRHQNVPGDNVVPGDPIPRDAILRVKASTVESADTPPGDAIDGTHTTRWSSKPNIDPSWLMVELKEPKRLTGVQIQWETAAARRYSVEVSMDGTAWTSVASVEDGANDEWRALHFPPITVRYVRVMCLERTTEWGYSIEELTLNPDAETFK
jgi:hypothetical protein